MKKVKTIILAAVVAVATFGSSVSASGYINQADIDAIDRAGKVYQEYLTALGSDSTTGIQLVAQAERASQALQQLMNHPFSTKINTEYLQRADDLKAKTAEVKKLIDEVPAIVRANNLPALQENFAKLQQADKALSMASDELNKAVEKANDSQSTPYLWALIGTAVLAVVSAVWAFMKREATPELTKHRRGVALASIWPLLGAGITYGTFAFADKLGGKFYIMYGLIIFGLVAYASAVGNYLKARKAGAGHNQTPPAMPQA